MSIIKSFLIALSMYSKIPVPRTEWKEKDMRFVFVFFPFIGVIIGAIELGWLYLCDYLDMIPDIARVFVAAAIPIVITGGIHVDGFMDTMDAFHSYRDREKKLEILKDPHIGAFSVIMLALYGLIFLGALSFVEDAKTAASFGLIFVLSRSVSGFCALSFKSAHEGTLDYFTKNSSKTLVKIIVIFEAVLVIAGMIFIKPVFALCICVSVIASILYYYLKTKKEFGGVTGDTAGYLLLITERNALLAMVIISIIIQRFNVIYM